MQYFRESLTLFTYLHLAPLEQLTQQMLDSGITAIAYETVEEPDGRFPLLEPMSEVAGRLAPQVGSQYLEKIHHGRGVLLGGVPGVPPAEVVIIGGGIVGSNSARVALGTGAKVTIIDKNLRRLRELDDLFQGRATTLASNSTNIADALSRADLLIGAVLVPGAAAPRVITREMIGRMKKGSVFVDVAIAQGGCAETSRPTSHSEPVSDELGIQHYCVTNISALVPNTSTYALTNATLPYLKALTDHGIEEAVTPRWLPANRREHLQRQDDQPRRGPVPRPPVGPAPRELGFSQRRYVPQTQRGIRLSSIHSATSKA